MSALTHSKVALDFVVEALARRFVYDVLGRITGTGEGHEGGAPRFVLGRAREGVVWRFRSDLDRNVVSEIARLAAREQGIPIDGDRAVPPERLVMIERRLAGVDSLTANEGTNPHSADTLTRRHSWVSDDDGRVVGELWWLD